jgi:hypothetical protein
MWSHLHSDWPARRGPLAAAFRSADPFPHIVLEPFLAPELCRAIAADFPPFERGSALNELGRLGDKSVVEDVRGLGPSFQKLDDVMRAPEFLELLGELSGHAGLIYDPDYVGGGTHQNRRGQELDPHVDFSHHPSRGWRRRLNLLLYLNESWDPSWGGCLELHSDPRAGVQDRVKVIEPRMNRCVIFETSERSWHGFRAIVPPRDREGIVRLSFAAYFYVEAADAPERAHSTVYIERPLPDTLRAGVPLSHDDAATAERLLGRRLDHLQRLWTREVQLLDALRDQLGKLLAPGRVLTQADWDALRWPLALSDEILLGLYDREPQLNAAIAAARALTQFPLEGPLRAAEPPTGLFDDGWVGARLELRVEALHTIHHLCIGGFIATDLGEPQRLVLSWQGGRRVETELPAGGFDWRVPLEIARGEVGSLIIESRSTWSPKAQGQSPDARQLAWLVRTITAV